MRHEVLEYLNFWDVDTDMSICALEKEEILSTDDPDLLKEKVQHFVTRWPNAEGWLCFQSGIHHFRDGALPESGIIRYGELAGDSHHSLIIRPTGRGWRLLTLKEEPGDSWLVDTVTHLTRATAPRSISAEHPNGIPLPGAMVYRRYWRRDPSDGYRPVVSRFQGFASVEGGLDEDSRPV